VIALQRTISQGAFEHANIARLQALWQALAEVGNLSAAMGHAVLTGTLNTLALVRWPAIAIGRMGRVLGTNAAADDLFDSSMTLHNGKLKASDEQAHQQLETLYGRLDFFSETTAVASSAIAALATGSSG
jgi:hypothetical protein